MNLAQILGRNVRDARLRKGLSQEQLGFEAGLKRSYVSDLERGTRNPTIKAIERLAVALEVEPPALLTEPPKVDRGVPIRSRSQGSGF
jgi:transcriptional regulator with XRE-family HTH domain